MRMANDDPRSAPPPDEVEVAAVERSEEGRVSSPPNALAVEGSSPPSLVDPETLVLGLRYLQRQIPGFVQLSLAQKRSMARAAYLDREFVETGIHVAGAWDKAEAIIGRSPEELRRDAEDSRRWDDVVRELRALVNGIADANLARKHRLGRDILNIYVLLGGRIRHTDPGTVHLRPYYEEMKRLYLRRLEKRKARGTAKEEDPDPAKE